MLGHQLRCLAQKIDTRRPAEFLPERGRILRGGDGFARMFARTTLKFSDDDVPVCGIEINKSFPCFDWLAVDEERMRVAELLALMHERGIK